MNPNLRLISDLEKPIRCEFYTLVVRTRVLKEKYKGGLRAFVDRYKPQCSKGLAVLCETSPYYLRDPILDLEGNGLNGKDDFVCFDAIHQAIGIEMAIEIGQEVSKEVNFSISWLKGHVQEGCVLVYLVDSE